VRAVLEHVVGGDTAARFAVFAGDIVPAKKPDPAIYRLALAELGVPRDEAIVIEDSRNGLLAAVGAGLRCVVTLSSYTGEEDMREADLVVTSLGDPGSPAQVVANRSAAHPGDQVTVADLEACLTGPLPDEEAV
jgi:beta-phosphoglucomutase-like phosphatase (HAD superfamily)